MGALNNSGSADYTLGTSSTLPGSSITSGTTYGGATITGGWSNTLTSAGVVNGHYTLGGSTVPYTLSAAGDSVTTSYTLSGGTSSYNMGAGGSATTQYVLPSISTGSTASGITLATPSGTATYTLTGGASTNTTASFGANSGQSFTLGSSAGNTATVTTVIGGVTTTTTLGSGDSVSNSAVSGDILGSLNEVITATGSDTATSSMTYNIGEGGSTSTTYGSNFWGVYLIRLGEENQAIAPYLAIMADDADNLSDAYSKSTQFITGPNDDSSVWKDFVPVTFVNVEGDGGGTGFLIQGGPYPKQYNYNCQRVKIASIVWNGTSWNVTQHLIGSLTIPTNRRYGEVFYWDNSTTAPDWYSTPLYNDKRLAWVGDWLNYTKDPAGTITFSF